MQLAAPVPRPVRRLLPVGGVRFRPILLAVLVLGVAAGLGIVGYQRFAASAPPAPTGQVLPVQRGNVAATVSATGSVVATRQAKLVFAGTGRIQEVLVNVGDHVTAGQPLARLQTDASQVKLETARSQLATAQLKLQQLTEAATPEDVAAAQAAYDAAVAKLNDLQNGATAADLRAAQAAVVQAQSGLADANAKLQTLLSGATGPDRASAQAALVSAQNTLASAQAKLDQVQSGPLNADVVSAQSAVADATSSLNSARAKLDQLRAGPTEADAEAAQAAFDKAQADVTNTRLKLDQTMATASLSPEIIQAQSNLAAAESKLHTAHQSLDQLSAQLQEANADLAGQQAQLAASIKAADQTCSKLGNSSGECANARAASDAKQAGIVKAEDAVKLLSGNGAWDQLSAQKDVLAAQAAYESAAAALKQAEYAHNAGVDVIAAQTAYDSAVSQLTSARAKLDQVRAGATAADLASAQAARASQASAQAGLQSAQAKLAQLQAGPTQTDLESARSGVAAAVASLSAKSGNVRPSDVALQQEAVRQAELAVQQAQIDLDNNTLVAPFDGTVAAIAGNPGEPAPSGTNGFLTLVDPSAVRVDVTVDETDVAKVAVGKPATITFDALPGRPFRGSVSSVSPSGTLSQGVVTYPVSIGLDTRNQVLPGGLTASATITIDEKENVLVVPLRADRP